MLVSEPTSRAADGYLEGRDKLECCSDAKGVDTVWILKGTHVEKTFA